MRRRHISIATVLLVLGSSAGAQVASIVAPGSPLPVTAHLRTTSVQVDVSLEQPAVLLTLEYQPERGWYSSSRLGRKSLAPRRTGLHTLTFLRRLGLLSVPNGTGFIADAQIGCTSPNGILDSGASPCGVNPNPSGFSASAPGPNAYRAAVLRVDGALTRDDVKSALAAVAQESPREGLERLVALLGERGHASSWALVRVPRGG